MTGNLFGNLLSLHISPVPEEDFFTEVMAWLLDNHRDMLFSWLRTFLNLEEIYSSCFVETQVSFGKLDDHLTDSRPDILISLFGDGNTDYVIIESKISSYEGYEQLPRYAEQLAERFPDAGKRFLVYITREYDPKQAVVITKKVKHNVIFQQLRWYEIYNFLKQQPSSVVLEEILAFMRVKHMTEITRITPATLSAFSSFPDVFAFFETVMKGEVTDKFTKVFGKKPKSSVDEFQYRRHVFSYWANEWGFLIGFWLPESGDDFPELAARLYVNPHSNNQKGVELRRIYKQIEIDSTNSPFRWVGHDLDQLKSWSRIDLTCSFSEIMPEKDHVAALRQRMLAYLDETKRVLDQHPYIVSGATAVSNVE